VWSQPNLLKIGILSATLFGNRRVRMWIPTAPKKRPKGLTGQTAAQLKGKSVRIQRNWRTNEDRVVRCARCTSSKVK
jgi:hypothetical protein